MEMNKKIIIVSDNHGKSETIQKIADHFKSDKNNDYIILHAGDILIPKNSTFAKFIDYVVKGNNDYDDYPENEIINVNNKEIFLCHGYTFFDFGGYKPNYDKLVKFMQQNNYDIFIHGHLHIPIVKNYKNKLFICPGSTDYPRNTLGKTFAILTIEKKFYEVIIMNSQTFDIISYYDFSF